MVLNWIEHVTLGSGVMVMITQNSILTWRKSCKMERNATGELENPFISLGEINGGSGAAEQLIYFTIYYQLNVQFNIIKWELVRTFYFFPVCTFLPP